MTTENATNDLEKTVIVAMDEQIARVSDITRKQDQAIAEVVDRLMELTVEMKKLAEANGKRTFDGGSTSSNERLMKVFCPKFDGTNPEDWIFLAKEYFECHGISEASMVRIAGLHMEGAALDWIRRLKKNGMLTSWEPLKAEIRERFGDSEYEDSLAILTRLQQT